MAAPRILPLGFIDRTTNDGAIIMLASPSDSHDLRPETPVTLRNRSTEATPATARVRGVITSVGYVTATFKTVETRKAPNWPQDQPVLQRGLPVYQALPLNHTGLRRQRSLAPYTQQVVRPTIQPTDHAADGNFVGTD